MCRKNLAKYNLPFVVSLSNHEQPLASFDRLRPNGNVMAKGQPANSKSYCWSNAKKPRRYNAFSPFSKQRGFTLVWAIFLVIVGGLISLFMTRIASVQAGGNNLALNSSRALRAARAGVEWAVNRTAPPTSACAASTSFTLTQADLNGYNVTVTCSASVYTEGASTFTSYNIVSAGAIGTYGVSADYAYRQANVLIWR